MSDSSFSDPPEIIFTPDGTPGPKAQETALAGLAYLWRLDNPEWVSQRELDWRCLAENVYADTPKIERKVHEEYFKFGKNEGYISSRTRSFLTPYTSVEQLRQLFHSRLLDSQGREQTLFDDIYLFTNREIFHWYESHMRLVIAGLLGDHYQVIKEQIAVNRTKVISPPPTIFCQTFVRIAIKGLAAEKEWLPFYECIGYFVSALPFALDADDRKRIKLSELLTLVDNSLSSDSLDGRAAIFAKELKVREQEILQAWDIGEQKLAAMKQEP